jgi:hypothetical protein
MSTDDDRDELALELALDRLESELAGDEPMKWSASRKEAVADALEVASLRARARRVLQRWAPAWIDQAPVVAAARLAPPSWAAYRKLRAAQDALASQTFDVSWIDVMRWHGGVPAGELPAPSAIPAMAPAWLVGSLPLPWRAWIDALERAVLPELFEASAAMLGSATGSAFGGSRTVEIEFSAARPRTRVEGRRIAIGLRDQRDMPRAWFQLLHELGHAVAAILAPAGGVPRAVDEAVASWLARHLEEPGSAPALPLHAYAPALHAGERARREAVAIALAHLETHAHGGEDREAPAAENAGLPWALWHDGGAQPAYLHAERIATRWWDEGLRLGVDAGQAVALARAIAAACAEAAALPAPFTGVR